MTISMLAETYIQRYAIPHKKSWNQDKGILEKHLLPYLGDVDPSEVKRKDIVAILDRVVDNSGRVQANRTQAIISKMFNYHVDRGELEFNPIQGMRRVGGKEQPRDRVLSDLELRKLWRFRFTPEMRKALRFMIVTGMRKCEALGLMWDDIEGDVATIPAQRTKTGREYRIILNSLALEQLKPNNHTHCFLSNRGTPFSPWAMNVRFRKLEFTFTPHDLRRTFATNAARWGIERFIISKLLCHADTSITAVYDRYDYEKEKRKAMEVIDQRLREIVC